MALMGCKDMKLLPRKIEERSVLFLWVVDQFFFFEERLDFVHG